MNDKEINDTLDKIESLYGIITQMDIEKAATRKRRKELEDRVYAFMVEMHDVAVRNVYRYRGESVSKPVPMKWFGMQFWPNHQNFEDGIWKSTWTEHIITTLTEQQASALMTSVFEGQIQGCIKQPRLALDYRFDFRGDGWVVLETKGSR